MNEIMTRLNAVGAETEDALERFLNDEEMYMKYVTTFPQEPTMKRLMDAVDKKDYEEAEQAVHALKGIVNNLGFIPLGDAAIDMLEALRDDDIDDALDSFEDLKKEYQIFVRAIES